MNVELSVTKRINILPRMATDIRPRVALILNKAIDDVSVRAHPRTPVDKGLLRANQRRIYATESNLVSRLHWLQQYAIYQEMGTVRGVRPKRFARDSFEEVVPGTIAALMAVAEGA
jgi:hypothetical protein